MRKFFSALSDVRRNLQKRWHSISNRKFYLLCLGANFALYTLFLCLQAYLSTDKKLVFDQAVNATVGAIATGTIAMFVAGLMNFATICRFLPWWLVGISGFCTFGIVGISTAMYAAGPLLAAFIAANLMKGSTFSFTFAVERLAEAMKWTGVNEKGESIRPLRYKLKEAVRMLVATGGVGLIVWANYIKNQARLQPAALKIYIVLLVVAGLFYSLDYAYRTGLMLYLKSKLAEYLPTLPSTMTKEDVRMEVRKILSALIGTDQFFCFLTALVVLAGLKWFGVLDGLVWKTSWMLSGVPYGLLAYFSAMMLVAPTDEANETAEKTQKKEETFTMLYKLLLQKICGITAALVQGVVFAVALHKQLPSFYECLGAAVVLGAILFKKEMLAYVFIKIVSAKTYLSRRFRRSSGENLSPRGPAEGCAR